MKGVGKLMETIDIEGELNKIDSNTFEDENVVMINPSDIVVEHVKLILNLSWVKKRSDAQRFFIQSQSRLLFDIAINKYSLNLKSEIYVIVNTEIYNYFSYECTRSKYASQINFITLTSLNEQELCSNIDITNKLTSHHKISRLIAYEKFNIEHDESYSYIYDECKVNFLNKTISFQNCITDSQVFFAANGIKKEIPVSMYIAPNVSQGSTIISKQVIFDYRFNYLDFSDYSTILDSSVQLDNPKEVLLNQVKELLEEFKFEEILSYIQKQAKSDKYWKLLYIEFLSGYGYEDGLRKYVLKNALIFENIKYPKTQKNLFNTELRIINNLISNNNVFIEEINKFLNNEIEISIDYLIKRIGNTKFPFINGAKLLNGLITFDNLTPENSRAILEMMESTNPNPYLFKRNVVAVYDYLLIRGGQLEVDNEFLSFILSKLYLNEELFTDGINNRLKYLNLNIEPNGEARYLNQASGNDKVAICITGIAKLNFEYNLNLIKYFVGDQLNADYFVQCWDIFEYYPGLCSPFEENDFKWSREYLTKIHKLLPKFIERKGNFEALFPETSNILFNKQFEPLSARNYVDILGDKAQVVKKYDLKLFADKYMNTDTYGALDNPKVLKLYERGFVQAALEKHMLDSNTKYDYVITIDINTVVKSKVTHEALLSMENNEVLFMKNNDFIIDESFFITRYENARRINHFWKYCQKQNSIFPYRYNGLQLDVNYINPIFVHAVKNEMKIKRIDTNFGDPYVSKKIQLPNFEDQLQNDLANIPDDNDVYVKYFDALKKHFVSSINNSENYSLIDNAYMQSAKIVDDGIELEVCILGDSLKKIVATNIKLQLIAEVGLSSNCLNYKVISKNLDILKHENDEIVGKVHVTERELVHGKVWLPTILLHEFTPMRMEFNSEQVVDSSEYSKYGLKFIFNTDKLLIGIKTKEYVLVNTI